LKLSYRRRKDCTNCTGGKEKEKQRFVGFQSMQGEKRTSYEVRRLCAKAKPNVRSQLKNRSRRSRKEKGEPSGLRGRRGEGRLHRSQGNGRDEAGKKGGAVTSRRGEKKEKKFKHELGFRRKSWDSTLSHGGGVRAL